MRNQNLDQLLAQVLEIPQESIRDDLEFSMAWNSLTHIKLMEALEGAYSITIGEEEMLQLTSVQAIREFVGKINS